MRPIWNDYCFYLQLFSIVFLYLLVLLAWRVMAPFAVWRGYFLVRGSYRLIGWSGWDDPGAAGRARISVTSVTVRGSNFPQLRTVSAPDRSPFSPTVRRNNTFYPPRCFCQETELHDDGNGRDAFYSTGKRNSSGHHFTGEQTRRTGWHQLTASFWSRHR